MAWFSKAFDGKIERHQQKVWAIVRCNIARGAAGEAPENLGVYRRDPSKYPDEPNLLPGLIEEAQRKRLTKDLRTLMKRRRV